ncbi:MAG: DUF4886 domain-containing protein [Candidatus Azobacteroides sp.]|nr:DUF4886 domain-containing protein [Candidatus Azobacteroides sp.]
MSKFINDDKTTTQWRVNDGGDEHWAQIDLKDPHDLNRIRIQWGEGVPVSYTLSASKNATDWQEVKTMAPSGTGQADVVIVNDVKEVRYLRIHLSGDENGSGFSIYEWEVFGEESDVEQVATLSVSPAEEYLVTGMEELRILSLNNSLIDYNEQPDIFNQLAAAAGKNATWEKQTRLGMTLRYHYEEGEGMISDGNPSAKYRIRSTPWTHIILQEQSTKPRTDVTDFLASVKLWVDYVKEYCPNPDARIILHLNWPYTDSEDFDGHMEELYENYKAVAEETGVSIYAVGRAFHIIYETDGVSAKNALYTDNRHPTVLASYLSACTIYEGIFGESPEGIDYYPSGISKDDAQRMQTRAHQAALTHRNVCDDNGTVPFAYRITDQFNRPMDEAGEEVTWRVNGGGTIGQDGLFESNGQTGTYTVSASYKEQTATATVEVIKFSQLEDEYVEITASRKYEQDFDSMGTEAEAELPLGWKVEKMIGANAQRTIGMFSAAGNKTEHAGGVSLASNATNGLYNFGNGNDTDRAIGGITTGDTEKTQGINVYVHLKNTGEEVIPGLEISYDVEKYRKGNNPAGFTMQLYCSPDGITWTSAGENFTTSFEADDATEGYAVVPGDVRSVSAYLPLSMAAGEELYLAWNTSVTSGTTSSGAQALALDNVVIAAGEPSETDYVEINEETYL